MPQKPRAPAFMASKASAALALQMASGDLSVRVGSALAGADSETQALGRDLDVMAERIAALLESERRLRRDMSHELRSPLTRLNIALELLRRLADGAAWPSGPYGVFYNVNFPAVPAEDVRGMRATYQGHRAAATFGVLPHVAPNGRTFLWLTHGHGNSDSPAGSDSRECHDGHITVTPLVADLTAHDLIAPLAQALG